MRRLLILPWLGCSILLFSCQKKESHSPPDPAVGANAVDVQGQNSGAEPAPSSPAQPAQPDDGSGLPPGTVVSSLSIQMNGRTIVGQRKKLTALAQYGNPPTQAEVRAQWTLVKNEAEASLGNDGVVVATKPGHVVVKAQFGNQSAQKDLKFDYPALTFKEDQFWVYHRGAGDTLLFNTPWDQQNGDDINKFTDEVPDSAKNCLKEARQRFGTLQSQDPLRGSLGSVLSLGATTQLIFLVNVVPADGKQNDLRRLDRDAYFWHWNRRDVRPSLAFSQFETGSWVWEVIASPGSCTQPDEKEMKRYLDYAATRLAAAH